MASYITADGAAKIVAGEFRKGMQELGVDTFEELCKCFWWRTADIKEEVADILKIETDGEVWLDEDGGTEVWSHRWNIKYRHFMEKVRHFIKYWNIIEEG